MDQIYVGTVHRKKISLKNVRKKLSMVGRVFTVEDLKDEMDKRRVFGDNPYSTVRNYIVEALKLNLIEVYKERQSPGKTVVYKKTKNCP